MKLYSQPTERVGDHQNKGFTLIEMIGVLAVIAILAAVLVPKVFEAINNSRINNAAMSCQTVKTAIADHYAKWGSIPYDGTATPPALVVTTVYNNYDKVLVAEQFLDKPLSTKISDPNDTGAKGTLSGTPGTRVDLVNITGNTANAPVTGGDETYFNLGNNGAVNDVLGSFAVVAVLPNVTISDARDLSLRIDGESLSTTVANAQQQDIVGRVKYAAPANGVTTVYVYLTHR
jgi:prepilin-type N-terminal cleavage/methylation domain-containing protein